MRLGINLSSCPAAFLPVDTIGVNFSAFGPRATFPVDTGEVFLLALAGFQPLPHGGEMLENTAFHDEAVPGSFCQEGM